MTPAAPWLAHAVSKSLDTRLSTKQNDQARPQLRLGLNVVAMLVLIGLVVAVVGVYLTVHPAVVPAHPGVGRVFYPTKMVTASTGWSWVEPSIERRSAGVSPVELWRTTDGGAHWTNASGSGAGALPNIPISALVIDKDLYDTVYVATDIGVFRTRDGGANWESFSDGLPAVVVSGLVLHRATNSLYVSTMGRGVYQRALS